LLSLALVGACDMNDDTSEAPTNTPQPTAPVVTREPTATGSVEATGNPTATDASPATTETATDSTATAEEATSPEPTPTEAAEPEIPLAELSLTLEEFASGLDQPIGMAVPGDGSGRIFILEKAGRIRIIENGQVLERPFLDISDQVGSEEPERGLLGLAFHPNYAENHAFYVNYTNLDGNTVISRFHVRNDDPTLAVPESETRILSLEQPAANHNGGHLLFGPDGYLYIGMGDGGASGDRFGNAQNTQTLLGAMLRIAPSTGGGAANEPPYGIPEDNPFVEVPGVLSELWAIGLRNPWRYSFDAQTGELYIADVGQNQYEEINVQPADSPGGENYGWPILEGFQCYESENCSTEGLTPPIAEYSHEGGNCSVTGGYVYRGQQYPAMEGVYFYADYCSGNIWGLRRTEEGVETRLLIEQSGALVSSFGQDEDLELYLLDMQGGTVYHLTAE
jgi:glucose/arabinose dehydrogenase